MSPDLVPSHPSEWRQLFLMGRSVIRQVSEHSGGYPFGWSFGGGTAMMLQIGHRESHDVDLFIDDAQVWGFFNPELFDLKFKVAPTTVTNDGGSFWKFGFEGIGEIDFIVAEALTASPFLAKEIEGVPTRLETIAEVISKKVYHRGTYAQARDIFDIAAGARDHRAEIIEALRGYPDQVSKTAERLKALQPEFVTRTIEQLMIRPAFLDLVPTSYAVVVELLEEVLRPIPVPK